MPFVTHVFKQQQRIENGRIVANDPVIRRANFEYNATGTEVVISIIPSLSPKRAYLIQEDCYTLKYRGSDSDYLFELECWPDNGTIKRLSVFRLDTGVEYRYITCFHHFF